MSISPEVVEAPVPTASEDLLPLEIPEEGIIAVDPVSNVFVWIYDYDFPRDLYYTYLLNPYGESSSPISRAAGYLDEYPSTDLRMPTTDELALIEHQLSSDIILPEWPRSNILRHRSGVRPFLPRERFNEYVDDLV